MTVEADSVVERTPLHTYSNGGFEVQLYGDGTKVRRTVAQEIAPTLPEQFDLKVTNFCDGGCAWCHEDSTKKGSHGDLVATLDLLRCLNPGTEVAIGGGDPLSHPDFAWFVRGARGLGLVPSVTVNGRHFDRSRQVLEELTSEGSLFGVGVSFYKKVPDWDWKHMVVHLIAGVDSPAVLDEASRPLKLLLLGYKEFGRGKRMFSVKRQEVSERIQQWYRELPAIARNHHVSMDNLAIAQLQPRRLFTSEADYLRRHMGEEGSFSMYIDAVTKTFGVSSYGDTRLPWTNLADMFAQVRALAKEQPEA